MRMLTMVSAAVCTLAMSTVVSAATPAYAARATLVAPVATLSEVEISGVTWRCERDQCQGKGDRRGSLDSYMKECRKVAQALGKLSSYTSRGRTMSDRDLKSCNELAGKSSK